MEAGFEIGDSPSLVAKLRAKYHLLSKGHTPDQLPAQKLSELAALIQCTSMPEWKREDLSDAAPAENLAFDQLLRSNHLLEKWWDRKLHEADTLFRQLSEYEDDGYSGILRWITEQSASTGAGKKGGNGIELKYFDPQKGIESVICQREGLRQFSRIINNVSRETAFSTSSLLLYIAEKIKPIKRIFQIRYPSKQPGQEYDDATKIGIDIYNQKVTTHHLDLISSKIKNRQSGRTALINKKDFQLYHLITERLDGPPEKDKQKFWQKCIDLAREEFGIEDWSQPHSISRRWKRILEKLGA